MITPEQAWQFPYGLVFNDDPVLPDGVWYWKVCTKDTDNQWSEFTE